MHVLAYLSDPHLFYYSHFPLYRSHRPKYQFSNSIGGRRATCLSCQSNPPREKTLRRRLFPIWSRNGGYSAFVGVFLFRQFLGSTTSIGAPSIPTGKSVCLFPLSCCVARVSSS